MKFNTGTISLENSRAARPPRIISPTRDDISTLRQHLTEGERKVLEVFDAEAIIYFT